MTSELDVLNAALPLYQGHECLALEEEFLLIGVIPKVIEKAKKYGFVHKACKYKLIGDTLYRKGVDLVLRWVPWKEELYRVLEENHEGACGGLFAFKITLHKILQEGYVWPSIQKDVHHWCNSCKRCQTYGKHVLKPKLRKTILAFAEDIGRHNAVDKVFGSCILRNISFSKKILLVSGRISSEIVSKCIKWGIPVVASRTSATSLALELAVEGGVTLVGFVRANRMNIYTNRQRLN